MINFQGKTFCVDSDTSVPIYIIDQKPSDNLIASNFLGFLNKLRTNGLMDRTNEATVIIADDQFVNLQSIKLMIEDIDIQTSKRFKMFSNGQQTLEYVDEVLSGLN